MNLISDIEEKYRNAVARFMEAGAGEELPEEATYLRQAMNAQILMSYVLTYKRVLKELFRTKDEQSVVDLGGPRVAKIVDFIERKGLRDLGWRYLDYFLTAADIIEEHGRAGANGSGGVTGPPAEAADPTGKGKAEEAAGDESSD